MAFKPSNKKNIFVYGAGEAGRQLVISLKKNTEFQVVGFIDDNKKLQKKVFLGQPIYSSLNLKRLISSKDVSLVFLAMPSIARNKRNKIIKNLTIIT